MELVFYLSTRRPATTGKTGEIQDQEVAGSEEEANITAQRQAVGNSGICPIFYIHVKKLYSFVRFVI